MAKGARHEVAPVIRSAFLRGLDLHCKAEGKTHSEIMADLIREEGLLTVMDKVAKFAERVSQTDINHSGEVSLVSILSGIGAEHDTEVEEESGSIRH